MATRVHSGRQFTLVFHYAVPDGAWQVELNETTPPSEAAGFQVLVAVIPDEDPEGEPVVHIREQSPRGIPHAVFRWFADEVARLVESRPGAEVPTGGAGTRA